jgi:hypothetical protein
MPIIRESNLAPYDYVQNTATSSEPKRLIINNIPDASRIVTTMRKPPITSVHFANESDMNNNSIKYINVPRMSEPSIVRIIQAPSKASQFPVKIFRANSMIKPMDIDRDEKETRINSPRQSEATSISEDYSPSDTRISRKLLSGFHPYYDKETDMLTLQCCTCCIGCWRRIHIRCTGCENFITCPIYCWLLVLLPILLMMIITLILTSLYAGGVIQG